MGNSNSAHKISAQDKAILDMKTQRDKLHQYQKRITHLTAHETSVAKQLLASGQKDRALLALRRKKYQESLLAKTDAQLAQLEILTSDVEFSLVQKDVLYGLQQGTKVLGQIQKEMGGIEGVEKLLGEAEEAREYTREVTELLAGKMSNQDEDEVEDELEALAAEINGVANKDSSRVALPEAPTEPLPLGAEPAVETKAEKARRRAKERAAEAQGAEPILT